MKKLICLFLIAVIAFPAIGFCELTAKEKKILRKALCNGWFEGVPVSLFENHEYHLSEATLESVSKMPDEQLKPILETFRVQYVAMRQSALADTTFRDKLQTEINEVS